MGKTHRLRRRSSRVIRKILFPQSDPFTRFFAWFGRWSEVLAKAHAMRRKHGERAHKVALGKADRGRSSDERRFYYDIARVLEFRLFRGG